MQIKPIIEIKITADDFGNLTITDGDYEGETIFPSGELGGFIANNTDPEDVLMLSIAKAEAEVEGYVYFDDPAYAQRGDEVELRDGSWSELIPHSTRKTKLGFMTGPSGGDWLALEWVSNLPLRFRKRIPSEEEPKPLTPEDVRQFQADTVTAFTRDILGAEVNGQ
jgi:hypothetical protein